jgi:hypothetical protein
MCGTTTFDIDLFGGLVLCWYSEEERLTGATQMRIATWNGVALTVGALALSAGGGFGADAAGFNIAIVRYVRPWVGWGSCLFAIRQRD